MDRDWNSADESAAGAGPAPGAGWRRAQVLVPKVAIVAVSLAGVLTAVMHTRWEAQQSASEPVRWRSAMAPAAHPNLDSSVGAVVGAAIKTQARGELVRADCADCGSGRS